MGRFRKPGSASRPNTTLCQRLHGSSILASPLYVPPNDFAVIERGLQRISLSRWKPYHGMSSKQERDPLRAEVHPTGDRLRLCHDAPRRSTPSSTSRVPASTFDPAHFLTQCPSIRSATNRGVRGIASTTHVKDSKKTLERARTSILGSPPDFVTPPSAGISSHRGQMGMSIFEAMFPAPSPGSGPTGSAPI